MRMTEAMSVYLRRAGQQRRKVEGAILCACSLAMPTMSFVVVCCCLAVSGSALVLGISKRVVDIVQLSACHDEPLGSFKIAPR
jgi:hypothetical protein